MEEEIKTKVCTKCGEEKPETTEYFHRHKSCRAGLSTICKECRNKAVRRWRAENPEKVREKAREADRRWKSKNPEKVRETYRRWKSENPEKVREADRRRINTLAPRYLKKLISAKYSIDISEIGDELIKAKRMELKYYRQLTHLKNQQNETK